jgi:urease subunit gamma/beta
VQLNPTEEDRLRVAAVAELARRTLARGLALNAPEAIGLVGDELHLAARSGLPYEDVMATARAFAADLPVIEGVADLVPEIRIEALLDEGTRLFVLREPFGLPAEDGPGAIAFGEGDVALAPGRRRRRLTVTNTSVRPIRVSSHYPFWRTNPALSFDREAARGFRLDVPAGDSVAWAPGETLEVSLVATRRTEDD